MDKAFMKQATPPALKIEDLRPIFIGALKSRYDALKE
jgi:hypothetical protein